MYRLRGLNSRGAHFEKKFIRFGWVMDMDTTFHEDFKNVNFIDEQSLPTHRLGFRLRGQSWGVEGVCLIKKSRRVLFLELKN